MDLGVTLPALGATARRHTDRNGPEEITVDLPQMDRSGPIWGKGGRGGWCHNRIPYRFQGRVDDIHNGTEDNVHESSNEIEDVEVHASLEVFAQLQRHSPRGDQRSLP